MRKPKQRKPNDLSRSLAALDVDHTLIAVVEMPHVEATSFTAIVSLPAKQPLSR